MNHLRAPALVAALALTFMFTACGGNNEKPATGITLTSDSAQTKLTVAQTLKLTATLTPTDSTDAIVWTVSDATLASIVSDGATCTVTGLAPGAVTITATAGSVSAPYAITVESQATEPTTPDTEPTTPETNPTTPTTKPATGVSITSSVTEVRLDASIKLTAALVPADSTDAVSWAVTGKAGIVSLNAATGDITGVSVGSTEITATAGSVSAKVTVSVPAIYSVRFSLNYVGATGEPAAQTVTGPATITKPADPSRAGYNFGGWYTSAAAQSAWDFAATPSANLTLFAKWISTDATLSQLTVNEQIVDLAKAPLSVTGTGTTESTVAVTAVTTSSAATVTIAPNATSPAATITGNGSVPVVRGKNKLTITVTAEDGTTQKTYTVSVYRRDIVVTSPADGAKVSNGAHQIYIDATSYGSKFPKSVVFSVAGYDSHTLVPGSTVCSHYLDTANIPDGLTNIVIKATWADGISMTVSRTVTIIDSSAASRTASGTITLVDAPATGYVRVYAKIPSALSDGPSVLLPYNGTSVGYSLSGISTSFDYTLYAQLCDKDGVALSSHPAAMQAFVSGTANLSLSLEIKN